MNLKVLTQLYMAYKWIIKGTKKNIICVILKLDIMGFYACNVKKVFTKILQYARNVGILYGFGCILVWKLFSKYC